VCKRGMRILDQHRPIVLLIFQVAWPG